MIGRAPARPGALARLIRAVLVVEVILFLVPAVLHAGVSIPLGFAALDEPVIVPATIAEGLIGLGFAAAAYGVVRRATWQWPGAVAAHVFALVGTLIGIGATFSGAGERTELNTVIHIIMLVVVSAGLALLVTAAGKAALDRGSEVPARGAATRASPAGFKMSALATEEGRPPATAPDMTGKTVLVTGGTRGIGKETARALARLGATVAIVGRGQAGGDAVVKELQETASNREVVLLRADLSSQAEVRRLAREVADRFGRLDALVNNAAVVSAERWESADGMEGTLAVAHLAPFLLTELLLPTLGSSAPSRIVNVSSGVVRPRRAGAR